MLKSIITNLKLKEKLKNKEINWKITETLFKTEMQ